jgi:integrase/transposase-like protein
MSRPKTSTSIFGTEQRAKKRKKHKQSVEISTHSLIFKYLPELTKVQINLNPETYETSLQLLLHNIEIDYTSIKDFRISRNYLAKFINEGNKNEKWQLDIPPFIHRVQREKTLRTQKWFKTTKALNLWVKNWSFKLETQGAAEPTFTCEEVLACTLISAALFGGLCIPDALKALRDKLVNEPKPLFQSKENIWIDLYFNSKVLPHNEWLDGKPITLQRWYPDNLTLMWIHHYLKERNLDMTSNGSSTWDQIRGYIGSVSQDTLKSVTTLNKFCESAVGITENLKGVHLSQVSVEYLIGRIPSTSLTTSCNDAISLQKAYSPLQKVEDKLTHYARNFDEGINRKHISLTANYEGIIGKIRAALALNKSIGIKNTPQHAKVELQKVNQVVLPKPLFVLIEWLIDFLNKNKKVSTVSRYFSAIGKPWLAVTTALDIDELDAEDFESLYRDILDTQISETNRQYMRKRFNQFHLYLARNHDLPITPAILKDSSEGNRPFVRAAFITEKAFSAFLETLNGVEMLYLQKKALTCLFVIAHRTGLRRGEILKLKLEDIEQSKERWLFIRNNRYGNNKTPSALRKIPLTILLTESESKLFEDYLAQKNMQNINSQALLFSESQTPNIPLDGNYISTLAKNLLTEITGFPVIFHFFRHTALSRLQIILENDLKLVNFITPYSQEQVREIQKTLGGFDKPGVKRDIYWALAGLAGHLTPETTFSNYLHFSDLIVANKLKKAKLCFSANTIELISGLSLNIINRIFRQNEITAPQIEIIQFSELLRQRLFKYSKIVKSNTYKKIDKLGEEQKTPPYFQNKNKPTIETCLAVLKAAEKKATMHELVLRFNIDQNTIQKWLNQAKKVAELSTSKNKSRLVSRNKVETLIGEPLAPSMPQSNDELIDANNAISVLKTLYNANKETIKWCISYFILHTNTSAAGIIFSSPEDLQKYLRIMTQVFPKNRWYLHLSPIISAPKSDQLNIWKRHSEKITIILTNTNVKRKSRYPQGKMTLYLSHKNEALLIADTPRDRYSTNTMTYLFHLLAIMLYL